MIEGVVYFDRATDIANRALIAKEREELEKLEVNRAPASGGTSPRVPAERVQGERDDAEWNQIDNR